MDIAGVVLDAGGDGDEGQALDVGVEALVGDEGLAADGALVELAAVIQVGEPAKERHVAVGKAAGDAQLEGFDVLGKLAEDVVVVEAGVEAVELAQGGEGQGDEQG